ncbi:MAG: TlpA family protein disulfide reductase [Verrucomicrobiota bacterium]|jgi:peroxiredoxin|nr:TlpA family protein disulfide reductase [Verrucomicrobiota bacterium]
MNTPAILRARFRLLLLLSTLLLSAGCERKPFMNIAQSTESPPPPAAIDNFTMHNLLSDFPAQIRSADYAGRVQLILFFLADDPSFAATLPDWNRLQQDLQERGFTLLGVVADLRAADVVHPLVSALQPEPLFPIGQMDSAILVAFGGPQTLHAVPTAFLLNEEGRLERIYSGHEPMEDIREDIDALLQHQPLPDRSPQTVLPEDNAA